MSAAIVDPYALLAVVGLVAALWFGALQFALLQRDAARRERDEARAEVAELRDSFRAAQHFRARRDYWRDSYRKRWGSEQAS